jgi:hypothetical protein
MAIYGGMLRETFLEITLDTEETDSLGQAFIG